MSRIHLTLLVSCLLALAVPRFFAQPSADSPKPPENLHVYLLISGPEVAGSAEPAPDNREIIDRCFLLNEKKEWEPARNPLKPGPASSFIRKMLEQNKDASIGLVNASADPKSADWDGKSNLYREVRARAKAAVRNGTLKGVIWHQGEGDAQEPAGLFEKLQTMIGNLRGDFNSPQLPFIVGSMSKNEAINSQLARLAAAVHASAAVNSAGPATADATLGEPYAARMMQLQSELAAHTPKPPSDIRFIDPHVHAMSVTPLGLRAVAKWMEDRNVERCIVSPLNHKGSRPQNEEEREAMLANFRPYQGKIDRMTIIDAGEVETVDAAVAILKREIADGAIAFGEHYGVGLMFDDPKNLLLYEACEKVGLPVMFHIDQNKNMVEPGMARVDRVLKMFPKCKIVAHAYWWRQLGNGTCDRQLQEHPNLYADMSGAVVTSLLNRDRKYAREFLIRNQDKILWATDEGWWSFASRDRQMNLHYTLFEELDLPAEVRHKIYRGNAAKVYGLK